MGAFIQLCRKEMKMTKGLEIGQRQRKEQLKMARTRAKGKKKDVKKLLEAENRRKSNWMTHASMEKSSEKTNQDKMGEE